MMSLALAMTVPSMAAQMTQMTRVTQVTGNWPIKAFSTSSGRGWTDGAHYSLHRTGRLNVAPAPMLANFSVAANGSSGFPGIDDYSGNSLTYTAITPLVPSTAAGLSFTAPSPVARSNDAASPVSIALDAGLSTEVEGYMTLLAVIGVMGFLAFKRGGAQSRY